MSRTIMMLRNRVCGKTAIPLLAMGFVVLSVTLNCASQEVDVTDGQITLVNMCSYQVDVFNAEKLTTTLAVNGGQFMIPFSQETHEKIGMLAEPHVDSAQCPDCDKWTPVGNGKQRQGYMWESPWDTYATYCNPANSGRGICTQQPNPCCGTTLSRNGTWGTTFEINPYQVAGDKFFDFPDLSTNYGTDSTHPPSLCPIDSPDNCVTKEAPIFYSVPMAWTTNLPEQPCSFRLAGTKITGAECTKPSCPDAYRTPQDDAQVACPSSPQRGYVVTYCPSASNTPKPH